MNKTLKITGLVAGTIAIGGAIATAIYSHKNAEYEQLYILESKGRLVKVPVSEYESYKDKLRAKGFEIVAIKTNKGIYVRDTQIV